MAELGHFLVDQGIIGPEQLSEAKTIAKKNCGKVHEVLVKQGHASSKQVMQAMADLHGCEFFDLRDVPIPPAVVELVPESVARKNAVIPLAEEEGGLKVLVSDPFAYETLEKLQFILNRKVHIALATHESILETINRNYGQLGDESADSMLQEFTDTAIDFTETEGRGRVLTVAVRRPLATVLLTGFLFLSGCAENGSSAIRSPDDANTIDVDLGGGVTMTLVSIPAGSFLMGSEDEDEKPVHTVTFTRPFYLGKYEVTQEQWQAVMGANPSNFKGDKRPVEQVSWDSCQEFLQKLQSKLPELSFSLPTEAQWEYACRAGSTKDYCFGDDSSRLSEYAWYYASFDGRTHDVGTKQPNAWGLYDMHGNVWEWCLDWYGAYDAGAQTDPSGPSNRIGRVIRGGAWINDPAVLRSAFRGWLTPSGRSNNGGLRVAAGT